MNSKDYQIIAEMTGYTTSYVRDVLLYKNRNNAVIEQTATDYFKNKQDLTVKAQKQRKEMKSTSALA